MEEIILRGKFYSMLLLPSLVSRWRGGLRKECQNNTFSTTIHAIKKLLSSMNCNENSKRLSIRKWKAQVGPMLFSWVTESNNGFVIQIRNGHSDAQTAGCCNRYILSAKANLKAHISVHAFHKKILSYRNWFLLNFTRKFLPHCFSYRTFC